MAVAKEATQLAKRINDLGDGWECVPKGSGKHGGKAFVVRRFGRFVAQFTATNFNRGVVRSRVEADLRRKGVPLEAVAPSKNGKEKVVATPTAESREATRDLLPRLRGVLARMGGDTPQHRTALSQRAVDIIGFRLAQNLNDVEQFGSTGEGKTAPIDVARQSLRSLLDQDRMATTKSASRWSTVLDVIESEGVELAAQNGDATAVAEPEPTPEPEPEPTPEPEPEPEPEREEEQPQWYADEIRELRERAELAESVVAEVEGERDEARAESQGLREQVIALTREADERAEPSAELAEAKREIERLAASMSGLRGAHVAAKNRLEAKLRDAERQRDAVIQASEEKQTLLTEAAETIQDLERRLEVAHASAASNSQERETAKEQREEALEQLRVATTRIGELEGNPIGYRDEVVMALLEAFRDTLPNPPRWLLARLDALADIDPLL